MRRLLPQSLFGQTVLLLLLGLVLSHGIGAWFYGSDRQHAVRAMGGMAVAQRIANNTRLIEDAPPEWRARIIDALSDASFRVSLSSSAPSLPPDEESSSISGAVKNYISRQMPTKTEAHLHVAVALAAGATPLGPPPGFRGPMPPFNMQAMPMGPGLHAMGAWRGLRVAVELAGGQWLAFTTVVPDNAPAMSSQFFLSMAIMAAILLAVSIWAVRRLTGPLATLAQAAERLGRDVGTEPLPEIGTMEMRQAASAFNRMQERLRRLIENRTVMLAAISHDLRTPLTLLRLRVEATETEERDKMLYTISEMNAMLEATLGFARDEAKAEPNRRVDLAALVTSLVDDMADAGLPVSTTFVVEATCLCQSQALRRALTNLIDNAIKYGVTARVGMQLRSEMIEITVDDDGPGIADDEMARVMQPFYRLEGSRNKDTGGIGLGLAIALSISQNHGGTLTLANRPEGGLRATIRLPL